MDNLIITINLTSKYSLFNENGQCLNSDFIDNFDKISQDISQYQPKKITLIGNKTYCEGIKDFISSQYNLPIEIKET